MPDESTERNPGEILRRAAERVQPEEAWPERRPTEPQIEAAELESRMAEVLRMRGIPREVISRAPDLAVWSKTYTENNNNQLLDRHGDVIYQTEVPLTQEEMKLIRSLGFEVREEIR